MRRKILKQAHKENNLHERGIVIIGLMETVDDYIYALSARHKTANMARMITLDARDSNRQIRKSIKAFFIELEPKK